jgi:hypothetical protein
MTVVKTRPPPSSKIALCEGNLVATVRIGHCVGAELLLAQSASLKAGKILVEGSLGHTSKRVSID